MKKILTLGLSFSLLAAPLFAKPISLTKAKKAAESFMESKLDRDFIQLEVYDYYAEQNKINPELYIFNTVNAPGFVIIAGDDAVIPVLAYSTENPFGGDNIAMSPEVKYWLAGYEVQIDDVMKSKLEASAATQKRWEGLLSGSQSNNNVAQKTTTVSPLVETNWGQWPRYNRKCPVYSASGDRVPAGCVATAMAQVMKFWNYPEQGTGSHSYNNSYGGNLSADFGATTYSWNNMPNILSSGSSNAEINAVATLMYQCGVAVEMHYTPNGSGASVFNYGSSSHPSSRNALKNYFKYDPNMAAYGRNQTSTSQWIGLMKDELDAGRPFIYTGHDVNNAGHAWVADGYNSSSKFHMNWGWRGNYNGYYSVDDLSPGVGGAGAGSGIFNESQKILMGIRPAAQFKLVLDPATFQPSADTVRVGDPYQLQVTINNTGNDAFDQNDYTIALVAYQNNQEYTVTEEAHTIPGGGSLSYIFQVDHITTLSPGSYVLGCLYTANGVSQYVPIMDANNNFSGKNLYVLPGNPNTIVDISKSDNLIIYPNPASQNVTITAANLGYNLNAVQVFDQNGRLIYEKKNMTKEQVIIPVSAFANGTYQLKVKTTEGFKNQQLIIKH